MVDCKQALQVIYGNASKSIMMEIYILQREGVLLRSFTMKHV